MSFWIQERLLYLATAYDNLASLQFLQTASSSLWIKGIDRQPLLLQIIICTTSSVLFPPSILALHRGRCCSLPDIQLT